ncbi:alkylphosphonate utilization protein, partial [Staphylococcus pseudintermedius]
HDGDTVSVISDFKIKGSSQIFFFKIPGFGQIGLKSEVVKKIK